MVFLIGMRDEVLVLLGMGHWEWGIGHWALGVGAIPRGFPLCCQTLNEAPKIPGSVFQVGGESVAKLP
jgi:hypothetical protein